MIIAIFLILTCHPYKLQAQATSYKKYARTSPTKRDRFQKEYGLNPKETEILVQNKELADYFENVISELKSG